MTQDETIAIGKKFWAGVQVDMMAMHNIVVGDLPDDSAYYEVGLSCIAQAERDRKAQAEYEARQRNLWDEMSKEERAYAKADRDLNAKYGLPT